MKRLFIGLISIVTLLCSCDNDTKSNEVTFNEDDYVTLSLSIEGEEEPDSPRTGFFKENDNIKFTFSKAGATTRPVHTALYDGTKKIYEKTLNWQIANNPSGVGRKLTYSGTIVISKSLIPSSGVLNLYAISGSKSFNQATQITPITSTSPVEIEVPFVMATKVKLTQTKLVISETQTATFAPKGNLVRVRITNNTADAINITGLKVMGAGHEAVSINPMGGVSAHANNAERIYTLTSAINLSANQTTQQGLFFWLPTTAAAQVSKVEAIINSNARQTSSRQNNKTATDGNILAWNVTLTPPPPAGCEDWWGDGMILLEGNSNLTRQVCNQTIYYYTGKQILALKNENKLPEGYYWPDYQDWTRYIPNGESLGSIPIPFLPGALPKADIQETVRFSRNSPVVSAKSTLVFPGGGAYAIRFYDTPQRCFMRWKYIKNASNAENPAVVEISYLPYEESAASGSNPAALTQAYWDARTPTKKIILPCLGSPTTQDYDSTGSHAWIWTSFSSTDIVGSHVYYNPVRAALFIGDLESKLPVVLFRE